MSIENTNIISRGAWGGYEDPSLPIGTWSCQVSDIGDATGGTSQLVVLFQDAGAEELDSNMYSLEQFSFDTTDSNGILRIGPRNVGIFPALGILGTLNWNWTCDVDSPSGTGISMTNLDQTMHQGKFLGGQVLKGFGTGINFVYRNTDIQTYRVVSMGYMWGSRSRSTPAGPKRPVQGLW